jgi:hypothetical protein
VQLLELVTDSSNQFLVANMQSLNEFLKKWQPSFCGTFALNEFRHINPLKRVCVSRTPCARSLITNGSVSLVDSNIKITEDKMMGDGHVGIEEALDLALLIPYNPV